MLRLPYLDEYYENLTPEMRSLDWREEADSSCMDQACQSTRAQVRFGHMDGFLTFLMKLAMCGAVRSATDNFPNPIVNRHVFARTCGDCCRTSDVSATVSGLWRLPSTVLAMKGLPSKIFQALSCVGLHRHMKKHEVSSQSLRICWSATRKAELYPGVLDNN